MIKIRLDNGTTIPLLNKSLLILPARSKTKHLVNNEHDYDVIIITEGIDRTINIELHLPAIIIVEAGIRTVVNVTGGMALPISQAVLIGGVDNKINGLSKQNFGKIISTNKGDFNFSDISSFDKITIG